MVFFIRHRSKIVCGSGKLTVAMVMGLGWVAAGGKYCWVSIRLRVKD
ncbi:hypothetical protein HanRHA438_Chr16g0779071 [Helianthus annuus]|nr:hypothetical protein HanRHA438_Chr16g0779071 [Helianthus annuus]